MKNKLLRSFLLVSVFFCLSMVNAQTTVTGTVTDESGPLPGVNVSVQGTSTGTTTDFDGNYTLNNVDPEGVLVFSFVGYKTQQIGVNNRSTVNVNMETDASELEQVVVIGYGQTTVKDATGAVTSVTSEQFNKGVIASPEELIQGKTAGVQITQSSGEPGAGVSIRIRGSNSIRSNNSPLFVVDGVPLSGENTVAAPGDIAFGGGSARNPLSFLNPNDIESMSILKDASATAIYGSRGANGVVIITTKSGRGFGEGKFEYSANVAYSTPADEYDLLNRNQYLNALEQFGNPDASSLDFGADTNWQDVITRSTVSQNHNLSFSKGFESGSIRATWGYSDQEGVVEKSEQEKVTARLNARKRFFNDKLNVIFQGTVSKINDQAPPLSASAGFNGDLIGASYLANPTWPNDPNFDPGGGALNPASLLEYYRSSTITNRVLLNASAEYDIIPELAAKVTVGYDKSESENLTLFSPLVRGIQRVADNGQGSYNQFNLESNLLEATLTYDKDFGDSSLDIIAGYSYQDFTRYGFNSQGFGFTPTELDDMGNLLKDTFNSARNSISGSFQNFGYDPNGSFVNRLFPNIDNTGTLGGNFNTGISALWGDTYDNTDELQSFFARANYSLMDKFLLTATFRADGSSRFGPENQYGYFPSGAFAWKLSEEDVFADSFSTLKVRLGVGKTGNQEGLGYANFVARQRFGQPGISDAGTINRPGTEIVAVDNPNLKWEETLDYNIGLDFGLNMDRFTGSLDFYRKETSNLLFRSPAPAPASDPFLFVNLENGIVLNQGVELGLEYDFISTDRLLFSAAFNISYNDNEVQGVDRTADTGAIRGAGLSNAFAQRLEAGQPLFSYYMAVFEGLDENGFPVYEDVNGNGIGDPASDKKFVGEDALPDVNAGLNLNLTYDNWTVGTFLTGQFGFSVYNATRNAFFTTGAISTSRNVTTNVLSLGEAAGTSAEVSTRYLEKGDFIRMQNASLGYDVPLSEDSFLSSLRFSLIGQNLFLITDYTGLDPEVTSNTGDLGSGVPTAGIDYGAFPRPRTITFGLNAAF
ncbi:SusC/RagA family TonB-linked outer membrane protein [Christiangramia salexigens]|uniref:SusC/RagA family TonB-linked outer membrane protein n=1 Tax=Christiangramia salexigens TaxID=1913577 RepID=A0A1L3J3P6_9FLAO|nr:SusC/RagA family TonB-linked outer membrane protein [Christiangramia salexigens]APG59758.1 SusC/RagA family TonB-linked outer membrane protein [Christiangramia salexigens]